MLTGKPAANWALYAAPCSLVVLIPHYLRCVPGTPSRLCAKANAFRAPLRRVPGDYAYAAPDRVLRAAGVFVPGWVIGSQDSALICGVAGVTVVPGLCTVQAASQQGRVRWPRK
jgi:hypothetical protein